MHSSAKSPGLPEEGGDQRQTHIQMGVHGLLPLETHTETKTTSTQRHKQVCTLFLHLPSASLFYQSGWVFSYDPQQGISIS